MQEKRLIVGLGNPGKSYEQTRHNIGFQVIRALANRHEVKLRSSLFIAKGTIGEGLIADEQALLLMPLTFMNESGRSVKKCADYFKIPPSNMLIVADDVALPFGKVRIREKGSSGGHNGLKSIQAHLGTEAFPRLRIGVGKQTEGDLSSYVLGSFTMEEQEELPSIIEEAMDTIEDWLGTNSAGSDHNVYRAGEQ